MPNEQPNTTDTTGEEDNKPVEKPEEVNKSDDGISPLDRLEAANKEKKELLELENKTLDRREKIVAAEGASGRSLTGNPQTPEDIKKAAADERVMAIGRAGGASWAKKKE